MYLLQYVGNYLKYNGCNWDNNVEWLQKKRKKSMINNELGLKPQDLISSW